jgi:small-conductance mechanosensitive channel
MQKTFLTAALLASVATVACGPSRAEETARLAEAQALAAQKDSLLNDMTATTAFLADVSRQISSVRNLKTANKTSNGDLENNLTPAEQRTKVLDQVREITERLTVAENRLATSRKRVAELTGTDAEKTARLAAFDSTVSSFKDIIENQKTQLATITEQMNQLQAENTAIKADNVQLVSDKTMLTVTKDSLTTENNTVYYIVADQKTLLDRNLIEKKGGFLGLGKTPVVSTNLDKSQFIPIDRTKVDEIPLPNPDKNYKVLTRQDVEAIESTVTTGKKGEVKGAMKIRNQSQFWANSKYLILVELD